DPRLRLFKTILGEVINYLRYSTLLPLAALWLFMFIMLAIGIQLNVIGDGQWLQNLFALTQKLLQLPSSFELHINNGNFAAIFGKVSLAFYLFMTLVRLVTGRSVTLSFKGKVKILIIVPIVAY